MPQGRPTRASVYARLDAAISELRTRLGGLPSPEKAGFAWHDIWHLEAHHSTALEGNTLAIREAEALLDNLNRFILPSVAGPERLVPLAALVDEQFSITALRQAAQRGRLEAFQGPDGVWRSSRNAVEEYARTKGRRTAKADG